MKEVVHCRWSGVANSGQRKNLTNGFFGVRLVTSATLLPVCFENSLIMHIPKPISQLKRWNSAIYCWIVLLLLGSSLLTVAQTTSKYPILFPQNGATEVNPDTYFQITFSTTPTFTNQGRVRIFDASNDSLVDELDMAISPGPKNTRTPAPYDTMVYPYLPDSLYTVYKPDTDTTHLYQINYIGGTLAADAYHFYPMLLEGNSIKIFPHNNRLSYGKTYYLVIDEGVIDSGNSTGFQRSKADAWRFSTKKQPPSKSRNKLLVSADGTGDFTTIQGAIDFIPEGNTEPVAVFIRNGVYNEIINCRNRHAVSFTGEDRNKVVVRYPNNGVFNLRAMSPDPALNKGIHNIRAVAAFYDVSDISLANMTIQSVGEKPAQAEALLVIGDKLIVDNVSIEGSGDALQATGRIYVNNSKIQGFGDNVLGYGAVFFHNCEFVSTYGPHLWVRNTDQNHGNVLLNCTLRTIGDVETDIARAPDSNGKQYPFVEAVLINCKVEGLRPSGWGKVTEVTDQIKYWEYNTTDLVTGKAVDVSQRNPVSRQLTMEKDAELIALYSKPAFILDGWEPQVSTKQAP